MLRAAIVFACLVSTPCLAQSQDVYGPTILQEEQTPAQQVIVRESERRLRCEADSDTFRLEVMDGVYVGKFEVPAPPPRDRPYPENSDLSEKVVGISLRAQLHQRR